jgi:hypothetical protein
MKYIYQCMYMQYMICMHQCMYMQYILCMHQCMYMQYAVHTSVHVCAVYEMHISVGVWRAVYAVHVPMLACQVYMYIYAVPVSDACICSICNMLVFAVRMGSTDTEQQIQSSRIVPGWCCQPF